MLNKHILKPAGVAASAVLIQLMFTVPVTQAAETLQHKWLTQQLTMTDGSTTSPLPSFSRDNAGSDGAQGVEGRRGDSRPANADDAGQGNFSEARRLHRESGGGGGH